MFLFYRPLWGKLKNNEKMKTNLLKINVLLLVVSFSGLLISCAVQVPQNNAYLQQQQALQTEIDETELRQLLNLSEQELEQFKTNYISGAGVEGWSDWKKSINFLKGNQGQEYWNEMSSNIKMGLGTETAIEEPEVKELLQLSQQEFDAYKKYVIREFGEGGWRREKNAVYTLKDNTSQLHQVTGRIREIVSSLSETTPEGNEPEQQTTSTLSAGASELKKQLDEAKSLLDDGLITKPEYEAQRKKILSNFK